MKLVARNMNNTFAFGAVASAAPPKPQATEAPRPAPAAAPASAPKQPQMQEAARVIPSDQKRRIDFIYWLEPDCTTPELPVLRIIEQPRNGKVTVERSTGFTNFPQSNPRHECNRRKSDGVSLVFEPAPRFVGIESITVEILLPSGHAVKRHYTIEVKAVESVSSVPNPTSAN